VLTRRSFDASKCVWLEHPTDLDLNGVEGTGTYGAGLARFARAYGLKAVEVNRPDRSLRRRRGKSDPIDARATLAGVATTTPKTREGQVEMIRVLRVARRWQQLQAELDRLDRQLQELVSAVAPTLVALPGVGIDTAGQLLVTAGDNPQTAALGRPPSPTCAAPLRSRRPRAAPTATD
jgi:transposase